MALRRDRERGSVILCVWAPKILILLAVVAKFGFLFRDLSTVTCTQGSKHCRSTETKENLKKMEKETGILEWSLLGWGQKAELRQCRTEACSLTEKSLGFCTTENHLLCPCSSACDPVTLREDVFLIIMVPVFFHGAYFSFKNITTSASTSWRVLSPAGSGQMGISHVRNHLERLSFSTLVFTQGLELKIYLKSCHKHMQ